MKRVYFVVEGQTEGEFVREIIAPYFRNQGIFDVRALLIETSKGHKGGFVNYGHMKKLVVRLLKEEPDVIVTTLVDYFRIPNDLPGYSDCMKITSVSGKIDCLQQRMEADLTEGLKQPLLIPYIQKYEFEALLFSSNVGFEYCYGKDVSEKTAQVLEHYPNPEEINESPATAPSKRLLNIIPDYQKVVDGNTIALEIGIEPILEKCPRFCQWIETLIDRALK